MEDSIASRRHFLNIKIYIENATLQSPAINYSLICLFCIKQPESIAGKKSINYFIVFYEEMVFPTNALLFRSIDKNVEEASIACTGGLYLLYTLLWSAQFHIHSKDSRGEITKHLGGLSLAAVQEVKGATILLLLLLYVVYYSFVMTARCFR